MKYFKAELRLTVWLIAGYVAISNPHAWAEDVPTTEVEAKKIADNLVTSGTPAKNVKIDLSVPESPAFTALGLTPQEVIRPSTQQGFAAHLLNGADANGNFQNGLAIETNPWLLLTGNLLTLKDYQDSYGQRFLARTQLSLATAKGASDDDDALRLALGLRLTPWDLGDPRLDKSLIACFAKSGFTTDETTKLEDDIAKLELEIESTNDAGRKKALQAERDKKKKAINLLTDAIRDSCFKKRGERDAKANASRSNNWNRSAWSLGIAPTWISTTGESDDLQFNNFSAWTSFAWGFEKTVLANTSQILFSARYIPDEKVVKSEKCWIIWCGLHRPRALKRGRFGPRIPDRVPVWLLPSAGARSR